MTIFIGYQTALRYLRAIEGIGPLKLTRARPGMSWSTARKEIEQASDELAAFRRLIADGRSSEGLARPGGRGPIDGRQIINSQPGTPKHFDCLSPTGNCSRPVGNRSPFDRSSFEGCDPSASLGFKQRGILQADHPLRESGSQDGYASIAGHSAHAGFASLSSQSYLQGGDSLALPCATPTCDRLHLVVGSAGARVDLPEFESHVWVPPKGKASFLLVGSRLAISSPEACFVQLSRSADAVALVKLGYELCGKYRIDTAAAVGFCSAAPLTSVNSIKRFASAMGLGKTSKALKALDCVRDDSASPMETCLALLLGLPTFKGGYGLGIPVLNAQVEAPRGVAANANHRQYHCDLYWPKYRVGLEYNSSAFHLNERAMNWDSSRMNDFEAFGITGFTATREQVSNPRATDRLAFDIARAMGKRLRSKYADIEQRRMKLRKQLFSKDAWTQ